MAYAHSRNSPKILNSAVFDFIEFEVMEISDDTTLSCMVKIFGKDGTRFSGRTERRYSLQL